MPECFHLAICQSSIIDQATQAFSLINLVERVQAQAAGVVIPFEIISYWSANAQEVNLEHQIRMTFVRDADGTEVETHNIPIRFINQTMRVRFQGLRLPDAAGQYKLRAAVQPSGAADWIHQLPYWPFRFDLQQ